MGTITKECPPLVGPRNQSCSVDKPVFVSAKNVDHLVFSTCNTSAGTVVTVDCLASTRKPSSSPYLQCRSDGAWSSSLPLCTAPLAASPSSRDQLTLETRIIIGVVCGFAALVLLIILTLSLVYYKKVKKAEKRRNRSLELPETDFYWTNPILKRPESPLNNYYQTEINPMYSTRLWRPSYLERNTTEQYSSAHRSGPPPPPYLERRDTPPESVSSLGARWYNRQRGAIPSERTIAVSPSRPTAPGDLYKTIHWNPDNMKWHENFNYTRDGRLPRYHMDEQGLYRGVWAIF